MNILIDGQTLQSEERNRGIGVYFKNMLNCMVKGSYEHNWYIAVSNAKYLQYLNPWVAQRVKPVVNELFAPSTDYSRTECYTAALQKVVKEKDIDLCWNPNPLMVNVLFPNTPIGCPLFITIHDLIPAVMPIAEWSDAVVAEYYRRFEVIKAQPEVHCICISNSTLRDVEKLIGGKLNARVVTEAANKLLFYTKRTTGGTNANPYLLFTGGFDYRKNIHAAVEAFGLALKTFPENASLQKAHFYLVCNCAEEQKREFYAWVEQIGLKGRIELTGFIPDEELSALYAKADVFFFPSLYEGFGLPILEAMLGGAYVVSADNSSLPEVCGEHALLCDAKNLADMAEKLNLAFVNAAEETTEDKQARQEYALTFSWEKAAGELLDYFATALPGWDAAKRLKLALVTPWPNQQTGIAHYVYQLMPELTKYFDIDIFADDTVDKQAALVENQWGGLYSIERLEEVAEQYDKVLYQFGNNVEYHRGIYAAAKKVKGVGELHDFVLHHYFYHMFFLQGRTEEYREALELAYGEEGIRHFELVQAQNGGMDTETYPMAETVASLCEATICHNNWSRDTLRQRDNVYVIPLASFPKANTAPQQTAKLQSGLRQRLGLQKNAFLVGVMGFVNANKRPEQLLAALNQLKKAGYDIQLVFLGKANYGELQSIIQQYGLEKDVAVSGYLEKEEYEAGLALCDVIINLRFPSMGESSATLCEAFRYGKPVLVSETNQYLEFPDEVCWKVPVGDYEVPVLARMLEYLIEHPEVRKAMGENAAEYASTVLAPARIAKLYAGTLQQIKEQKP